MNIVISSTHKYIMSRHLRNEMVSVRDTEISLHIWAPNLPMGGEGQDIVVHTNSNPKCQEDLAKFSAKICPNFHWGGEGRVHQTNIPEILEWGALKEFWTQIHPTVVVSHILHVWILMKRHLFGERRLAKGLAILFLFRLSFLVLL